MKRATLWMAAVATVMMVSPAVSAAGVCCAPCVQVAQPELVCVEREVHVPQWVLETRTVKCVEYRPETREKSITVMRTVPVQREVERRYTVLVPQIETDTVTYTVAVPVWEDKEVEYTVLVPRKDVREGVRKVRRTVPVTETRTVVKDQGHWEEQEVTVPVVRHAAFRARRMARRARKLGCCTPCVDPCQVCEVTQVCKVWVPDLVEEEVEVTVMRHEVVEEPYEYVVLKHEPEVRTKTVKVCRTELEERTKEVRRKVMVPEERVKTLTLTSYEREPEEKTVTYTVLVPHEVEREVQVRVCRMVPKTVKQCQWVCK